MASPEVRNMYVPLAPALAYTEQLSGAHQYVACMVVYKQYGQVITEAIAQQTRVT